MVSREASFLFNNLLLVGIAFSVLWGTMFPILSELVRGTQVTVGPPFFNQVNIPIGLGLLALTGIGPLIAWRKASTRNLQRQFVGPVVVTVLVAVAFAALGVRDMYAVMAFALSAFVLATRGELRAGLCATRRAQPSPVWRLHSTRRHSDLLRGIRRERFQERNGGVTQAG
jgi:cytochrome c-type biogenesis protein CcmF